MAFMAIIMGLGPLFTYFWGLGRVCSGFRVQGFGLRVQGSGLRVQRSRFRV